MRLHRFVCFLPLFSAVGALATTPLPENGVVPCDVGPVTKTFGSVPWLVYSCKDSKSLLFLRPPGSPAAPTYLFLTYTTGGYHLSSEGTGSQARCAAALEHLGCL